MKIIPKFCIGLDCGINQARKKIKNHDIIKFGIVEWRKTRTYKDEDLKVIFNVKDIWTNEQMLEFMNQNKSWTDEEESALFEECKKRI
jgi:hypothetical protein